tara:strand:+ start:3901 stop:5493 length:1593 start_codon:yes stop_codon:yes gene_type:complete
MFLFNTTEVKTEELKVEIMAPGNAEAGSEFIVEVKITGGKVKGFAKYVDVLPAGTEASAVQIGDATFTADNGQIKILWVNFPETGEVILKYKVKVLESASGILEFGGKFSYLDNNEKRLYSVFKKQVVVGGESLANKKAAKALQVDAVVNVTRKVVSSKENIHKIEITVNQTGLDGFGKIQEFVPLGAKIEKGEFENAVFSSIKNKVKYVWMAMPRKETYVVTYFVDLSNANDKDIRSITGDFSYLENDVSKKVDINFGDAQPLIAAATSTKEDPVESKKEESDVEQETSTDNSKSANQAPPVTGEEKIAVVAPVIVDPVKKTEEEPDEVAVVEGSTKDEEPNEPVSDPIEDTNTDEIAQVEPAVDANDNVVEEEVIEEEPVSVEPSASAEATGDTRSASAKATGDTQKEEPAAVVAQKEEKADPVESKTQTVATGVRYRVQIAAGKNVVNPKYFKVRHNFETEFNIENHQGWVKYTTGSYSVYKDARDSRETINAADHKFDGPFVTAYNSGTRITVQEALMISNQKWYK